MRAAARFSVAVLIVTTLILVGTTLNYIKALQGRTPTFASGLLHSGGAVGTKPHQVTPNDGSVATTVSDGLKADESHFTSVSITTPTADLAGQTPAPKPGFPDQIVVIGHTSTEDISWVEQLDAWKPAVYSVDNLTSPLHTSANKGREANVYLTYILDNYHQLPLTIAFVHSHEKGYPQAWHTDAEDHSNVRSLRALNVDFVQRNGYANLRCIPTPGCPDEIQPFREPYDQGRTSEHAFPEAWKYIFENEDVPHVIATPCCAQFAISRDQVLKRPLEFYARAHRWLQNTPLNDDTSGRVFEYLWHIIFGQEPVYCPYLQTCYKDVYNR